MQKVYLELTEEFDDTFPANEGERYQIYENLKSGRYTEMHGRILVPYNDSADMRAVLKIIRVTPKWITCSFDTIVG